MVSAEQAAHIHSPGVSGSAASSLNPISSLQRQPYPSFHTLLEKWYIIIFPSMGAWTQDLNTELYALCPQVLSFKTGSCKVS